VFPPRQHMQFQLIYHLCILRAESFESHTVSIPNLLDIDGFFSNKIHLTR
jgi:hypothetical protein